MFNNHALGKSLYINGEGFKVVGVSESSGMDAGGMGMPEESTVQPLLRHLINIWEI